MAIYISTKRMIGPLQLDVSLKEDHESTIEVTSNPVERGLDVTDHAAVKPKKVTIQGGYSDSPFSPNSTILGSGIGRIQAAWEQLTHLQRLRQPLEVQTGLVLYKNMMITSLTCSQDVSTSRVLLFTAVLQEIRIVSTKQIAYPASMFKEKAVSDRSQSPSDRGDVGAPNVDTEQPSSTSWLRSLF